MSPTDPRTNRAARAARLVALPWHADAEALLGAGETPLLLLVGEPGTGKTSFAHDAARRHTGQPPLVLGGTPEVEMSHLMGRWGLAGGETRFIDGPLPAALKSGRWLVVEEFSQVPLECRSALLPLRDQAEVTNPLTGEVLPVPASFRLIATSNSETLTCRKNSGIAKVLYDGFFILEVPDLDDASVGRLLKHNFPKAKSARIAQVLRLWNDYRELTCKGTSGKSHLSYRAASHLTALLERGMDETAAVQVALVNKFLAADAELFSAAKLKNTISAPAAAAGGDDAPEGYGS